MLFNSIAFLIFLPCVFIIYWLISEKHFRIQNVFLLIASYFFYGWWDERFLILIAFSTCVDFFVGSKLGQTEDKKVRKWLLAVSLVVNLGLLGVFKYYNFFIDNFIEAFSFLGIQMNVSSLNIILPVGISFYTFQTLSYTIDIYRKQLEPTRDFISFAAFVSFFPQLVAGPIERASNLLPQFFKKREFTFEQGRDGMRQILWGMFKKVVIADNCAIYVNDIFADPTAYSSPMLILGAVFFAFQIYGDFSGYSDIAIGTARLFGFNLMTNFRLPYFARDIGEFWRRWHISLTTWFRDYLYIPLGGSRVSKGKTIRNVFIIFLVSGFWHGANWTFIIWGLIHALMFVPLLALNLNRRHLGEVAENRLFPKPRELWKIFSTFFLVTVAWIFFRADSLGAAFSYLREIADWQTYPNSLQALYIIPFILLLIIWEWLTRNKLHGFEDMKLARPLRWGLYLLLVFLIMQYFDGQQEFIYFQF